MKMLKPFPSSAISFRETILILLLKSPSFRSISAIISRICLFVSEIGRISRNKTQINDIKETCKNTVSVRVDNIGSSIEVYIDVLINSLEEKIECLENSVKEDKEEVFKIYGKLWINYFPNKKLLLEEFNAGSFSLNNGRSMKDIERKFEDWFNTLHAIK